MLKLFDLNGHKNIMFNDMSKGKKMIQSNQHIIVHNGIAMMLDPGGAKLYSQLFLELSDIIQPKNLKYIFFSHQDPDIISSANTWFTITDANAYISELWIRFMYHFVVDDFIKDKVTPIPDKGMDIDLNGVTLKVLPAHFLHSAGNFQLYDPISKILYSGDLGASFGANYYTVDNFSEHIKYIDAFHRRYIPCNKALKLWVEMIKQLEIDMIVPQHGAVYATPDIVKDFIDWVEWLPCGVDIMKDTYVL